MTADFTVESVTAAAQAVTPARARHVLKVLRGRRGDCSDPLTPGEALVLWLADFLARQWPLPADQQDVLLDELGEFVADFGGRLWPLLAEHEGTGASPELPAGHLTVWNRRHASVTWHHGFLDLRLGTWHYPLERAPLTVEAVDLTALFAEYRARMLRRRRKEADHAEGDPPAG